MDIQVSSKPALNPATPTPPPQSTTLETTLPNIFEVPTHIIPEILITDAWTLSPHANTYLHDLPITKLNVLKTLNNLSIQHLTQVTNAMGNKLLSPIDFALKHCKPNKKIGQILQILETLFCHPYHTC